MNWSFVSEPMEFRAVRSRERKDDGSPYKILVVEDLEGYQNQISVSDTQLFPAVARLRRGEMYRFPIVAIATERYQFARLRNDSPIEHVTDDGDLEEI